MRNRNGTAVFLNKYGSMLLEERSTARPRFPRSMAMPRHWPIPATIDPFSAHCLWLWTSGVSKANCRRQASFQRFAKRPLVDWQRSSTGFPLIPGVRYPEVIQQPPLLWFGTDWRERGFAKVQPPDIRNEYKVLVPRCGPDGNELGCLLPPEVAVPLATFTGWSLRTSEAGAENELVGLPGSYIPFPVTTADREASGDPRRSLEERYGTLDEYERALTAACENLVQRRLLLKEDATRIVARQVERAKPLFEKINPR